MMPHICKLEFLLGITNATSAAIPSTRAVELARIPKICFCAFGPATPYASVLVHREKTVPKVLAGKIHGLDEMKEYPAHRPAERNVVGSGIGLKSPRVPAARQRRRSGRTLQYMMIPTMVPNAGKSCCSSSVLKSMMPVGALDAGWITRWATGCDCVGRNA